MHGEFCGDGEERGDGEKEEQLELIGLPGMVEDGDEGEVEDPEQEKQREECELRDRAKNYLARRVLQFEVVKSSSVRRLHSE